LGRLSSGPFLIGWTQLSCFPHSDAIHNLPKGLTGRRLQDNDGSCPVHRLGLPEELGDGLGVGLVEDQLLLGLLEPKDVLFCNGSVGHPDLISENLLDGKGHGLLLKIRCLQVTAREHEVDVELRVVILLHGHHLLLRSLWRPRWL